MQTLGRLRAASGTPSEIWFRTRPRGRHGQGVAGGINLTALEKHETSGLQQFRPDKVVNLMK